MAKKDWVAYASALDHVFPEDQEEPHLIDRRKELALLLMVHSISWHRVLHSPLSEQQFVLYLAHCTWPSGILTKNCDLSWLVLCDALWVSGEESNK